MEFWLSNWETIIGFGLTFASAVAVWWRKVRPVVKRIVELSRVQEEVYKQLSPNGGSSVSDKVAEILKQTGKLESQVERITNQLSVEISCRRFLFQRTPDAIYECGPDGGCTWVNQALADLFGIARHDALGAGWLKTVHEDDRIPSWESWQKSVKLQLPYEAAYRIRGADGEITHVRTAADACYDREGKPLGFFGVVWRDGSARLDPYDMFGLGRLTSDPDLDHQDVDGAPTDQE